ncbi:PREDICTED: protein max-like [Priapulus caudatus]|uniref:Protein max-like n=1 Tax=Priapulus caudatus TaxID=37621 RepID=A0ABM1EB14_PRICU|nr:PREDICTED: protein max-like [Priapulus caudatus]
MRSRNSGHQKDIDTLKSQNQLLESQVRALEKAIAMDGFPETQMTEDGLINLKTEACEPPGVNVSDSDHGSHNSPDHQVAIRTSRRKKKLKPLPGE